MQLSACQFFDIPFRHAKGCLAVSYSEIVHFINTDKREVIQKNRYKSLTEKNFYSQTFLKHNWDILPRNLRILGHLGGSVG